MDDSNSRTLVEGGAPGPSGSGPGGGSDFGSGRRLDRFRLEALLGSGGMGRVYEAWDPRLKRRVAVKVMREADPRMLERFLHEARAQAALSHPGICPVFEVGEEAGAPFIVMQRLEGRRLDEAAKDLPLDAKLRLVRRVAEAVHYAHGAGLIHRDLKPSNVMVEEPADGPPRPYVLDFGLALPLDAELVNEAITEGAMIGTPSYMAPEQVQGRPLDGRTDVYALGATLYHLLAGRPPFPFEGPSFLLDVLERDPPSLRAAGVPDEVEHIVFKCLEKDPARRYATAGELAEDLGRYVNGEAVLARPSSRTYRLGKWLRRHRSLAASLLVLSLVLVGSVGWSLHAERRARQREVQVSSFIEQVEEMEAQVRYSHMAPLHDIRPDRELLRRRMARMESDMEAWGEADAGAGQFALGSGHLALEELESAHRRLEAAWEAGYRTRETAAALAQTLSALYREHLSDLELVQDWESRRRRMATLEERYGDPLRAYLARSLPGDEAEPQLLALAHFHHDRFEAAVAGLEASHERRPWSYELPRLEGEIRRAWAIQKNADDDRDGARRQLELAREAYGEAAEIAESDPSIHRAVAQVAFQRLSLGAAEQDVPMQVVEEGLAAAERALVVDPEDARSWLWKARIHRLAASSLLARDEDPIAHLEQASDGARRAVDLRPSASAWRELARGDWGLARRLERRGEDPRERLDRAVAALGRVPPDEREYFDEHLTAMIFQSRAFYRSARGEDAADDFQAAIDAYRAAVELHSKPFGAWINLGSCALALAPLEGPDNVDARLAEAVEAFTRARELRPASGVPAYYLGRAYLLRAQGGRPMSEQLDLARSAEALEWYGRALEQAPSMFQAHIGIGEVHHLQALQTAAEGRDPEELFGRARAAYEQALASAPSSAPALANLAWTDYFEGKLRVRAGRDPLGLLESAVERSRRAYEVAGSPGALLCMASAHRMDAEWRLCSGSDGVEEAIERARRDFERLLELDPRHAEAHRSLGRLDTLEARRLRRLGEDPGPALVAARRRLERALELEPELAGFRLALARLALEEDDPGARARGVVAAEKALELRPRWKSAEAVLQRLQGEEGADVTCRDRR